MEKEKNKNRKIVFIMIIIVLLCSIFIIPYEQWIFRFETPEEALRFDYTAKVKKIIAKVEMDDYAYISYVDRKGDWVEKYLCKDERGWIPPIKKVVLSNKFKHTFEYSIISYIEGKEYLLEIGSSSIDKEKVINNVSDSIGTEFKEISYEYNGVYCKKWIGVVKEYPKDYKIYLDSEEISL